MGIPLTYGVKEGMIKDPGIQAMIDQINDIRETLLSKDRTLKERVEFCEHCIDVFLKRWIMELLKNDSKN
jgi:hypothetical protein